MTAAAAAAPPPDMAPPPNVAADEPSARIAALRTGKRVEVQSATTESARVYAEPTGSMTAELSLTPQRVRRPDNTWTPVNTALRVVNGSLRPIATVAPMAFSAGGKAPLARLSAGGGSVVYTWDGPLPTPIVEGDTAVYEEVYPDVDLRVQALADGFSYALVVKTRAAAVNPALRKVRLGVTGERLTVSARKGGGFLAKTKDGKVAIGAGGALMWDQRGASIVDVPADEQQRALMGIDESVAERALKAKDVLAAPADHARKSSLAATYAAGKLTVHTDLSLLNDPKAEFPIVIDPVSATIPGSGAPTWGFASSDNENRTDGIARVGPDPEEYSSVFRSFFAFPVKATINGAASITGAAFQTYLIHSASCSNSPVNLYGVGGFSSGRNDWPGASLDTNLGSRQGHANKSTCSQDDMFMEWKDEGVRTYVQNKHNAGTATTNFGLAIASIDGSMLWKKYDPKRTALWVQWNKKPITPVAADMTTAADPTSADIPCVGTPWARGRTPELRAALRDPDNEAGGQLTGNFVWQKWNGTAWEASGTGTKSAAPATPSAPGNRAEYVLPQLQENTKYRWQLTTSDSGGLISDPSPWCEFVVAAAPLTQKPTVTSADYPTNGVNGAVGQAGRFTFEANGVSSVAAYTYWLDGGPARTVNPASQGGSVPDVVITPTAIGLNTLHVMSRDAAGNSSEEFLYKFSVNGEQAPVSHWAMNGAFTDAGTVPNPATVNGGPVWTVGRFGGAVDGDQAVVLDGTDDYARVAAPVVDHRRALSMAAWVKFPGIPTGNGVLLSSGTAQEGVFELRYLTSGGWCFAGILDNAGTRQGIDACSGTTIKANEWTHVMGVYDPSAAQQLVVYVNGIRAGHTVVNASFETAAEFNIGAGKRAGSMSAHFKGDVSEVKVWRQALTAGQLQIAAELKPKSPANWDLNDAQLDPNATTVADQSEHANTLGFTGDATFDTTVAEWDGCTDSNDYTGAVRFGKNGAAGSLASAGPVLDSSASFTAAAFVCVADAERGRQVVLSQRGVNADGFAVYYDAGVWKVEMSDGDSATASVTTASHPATIAGQEWHHVAVVFDAPSRRLTLHVDGVAGTPVTMNSGFQPWRATGSFAVGSGLAAADWLNGTVNTIRLFSHALTGTQVGQVNNDTEVTYPSNHAPGPPAAVTVAGQNAPLVTLTYPQPYFTAALSDPDNDQLWFQVSLTSGATSAEVMAMTRAVPGTQTLYWPTASADWPANLTPGVVYSYKVRAFDGVQFGDWSSPIDVIFPKVGAVNYPPSVTTLGGGNAKSVRVALEPNSGDVGQVAAYRYGTDPGNLTGTVLTAYDGKAEVQFAPTVPTTVYFQSVMADGTTNPAKGDGKPNLSKVDLAPVAAPTTALDNDLEGDGRADVIGLMNVGGAAMPYVMQTTTFGQISTPVMPLGTLSYPATLTEHGVGDFDGDKRSDLAVFAEINGAMKLKVLRYNGIGFTEVDTGYVPRAGMNADRTKLMVGDVNGDGKDDVTIAFEVQSLQWALWVSLADGSGNFFGPSSQWYITAVGADYRKIKWFMGDFDGDGKADVGEILAMANCQSRFYTHKSTGTSFPAGAVKWESSVGGWCQDRANPVPVNFIATGGAGDTTDLVMAYRYDNCVTKVWRWENTANASSPGGFTSAVAGNVDLGSGWCADKMELIGSDLDGDGQGDLSVLYHCCEANQHQLWQMQSNWATSFYNPGFVWQGGIGPVGTGNVTITPYEPYQIKVNTSLVNRCLAIPQGSLGNTVQVKSEACAPVENHRAVDIYHDSRPEDYRIVFRHSNKCLNVRGAATTAGTAVDQHDCHYPQAGNDAWRIRYISGAQDPLVEIVAVHSGKCLSYAISGSSKFPVFPLGATQTDCTGSAGTRFQLRKATSTTPSGPLAWWRMNDAAGSTTLADSSSGGYNPATLMGGATVANGYASFNGTSGYAETTGSVLNTGASFTVSAWVKLTGANNFRTAVSQAGVNTPGFELGVRANGTGAEWQFERANSDDVAPTAWGVAKAGSVAPTGTWTHLIAVYDAPAGQMRLYVNRTLVSTVAYTSGWPAPGILTLGKAMNGDFWPGDIDDVRVWNRVVSDIEFFGIRTRS